MKNIYNYITEKFKISKDINPEGEKREVDIKGTKENFKRYMNNILNSFCYSMNYGVSLKDETEVMDDLKQYLISKLGSDENTVDIILKSFNKSIKTWFYKHDITR